MKQKLNKKLVLNKQTISRLNEEEMISVQGGMPWLWWATENWEWMLHMCEGAWELITEGNHEVPPDAGDTITCHVGIC